MKLYFALLHYPVYNKHGETVATSITNTDLHDLARIAKTYDINKYFVVTPLKTQVELCHRLTNHWTHGYGAEYNSTRKDALETLSLVSSYNCLIGYMTVLAGETPVLVATSAKKHPDSVTFPEMKKIMAAETNRTYLVLFGTGWGIQRELLDQTDYVLEPIYGLKDYNHLSVRCASAIVLDRLLSCRSPKIK